MVLGVAFKHSTKRVGPASELASPASRRSGLSKSLKVNQAISGLPLSTRLKSPICTRFRPSGIYGGRSLDLGTCCF
jgi:hypothetical protein